MLFTSLLTQSWLAAWVQFDTAMVRVSSPRHKDNSKSISHRLHFLLTSMHSNISPLQPTGQRLRTRLQHSEKHNTADGPLVFLPHLSNKSQAISCMSSDVKHSWLQSKVALKDDLRSSMYYGEQGFSSWFCFRSFRVTYRYQGVK